MLRRRPLCSVVAVALVALELGAQEAKVGAEDPAVALIRAMLKEAATAQAEGEHEDARGIVREALQACLELPGFAQRKDAHDLLYSVGLAAYRAADVRSAHDSWERVCGYRERTLPDDHPGLQAARSNLAATKSDLGDLAGACALQEKVYEVRSRTLPDDHPALQRARGNLALTMSALGDLAGARALEERVFEVFSRTLPDDHPDLQAARGNLAITKKALGDLAGACALQEKVFEVQSRTLPDDHPDLQRGRNNLALTKSALGDLAGACALREKVFEVFSRTLPDDHPDLQAARGNLALTKKALGDLADARALQEKVYEVRSRTLPDDHPDLQVARASLAATKYDLGDLAGAYALQEKVFEVRSRTLPDDHPDLQKARGNLALTKNALGDLAGARALQEKVFEVRSHTLPDDHPRLQAARASLAATKLALGDLAGARALQEKVYEVQSRTLPDDHPDLQLARHNLAVTTSALGDLAGARALEEKVLEVQSHTLPDDHPRLQAARASLAGTKRALGDLAGARVLQEKVYEVQSRTLPDDHPDLLAARNNLAVTKHDLGDLAGARALREKVFEVFSRTRPDDDPDLQVARANLALTKKALGDLQGARALQERVYEVRSRTLPGDHPDLQLARHNLAITNYRLGDLAGARALQEKVFEVRRRTLPDDHPDLQAARTALANTKSALGDLSGARALREKVYEVLSRTLPDDHPELQGARLNLALTKGELGDASGTLQLARERGNAARRRLSTWVLAPRELGGMAAQERTGVDLLLTLAGGFGEIEAQPEAGRDALALSQTLRGVQTRAARAGRRARVTDPERAAALETELRVAAAEVSRVAGEPLDREGEDPGATRLARSERLSRAVDEKERLERELGALAAKTDDVATASAGCAEFAAALPERSAAAAIVGFTHAERDPEHPGRTIDEARLAALVLARDGTLTFCPLGARAAIEDLVAALRTQVGAGRERGLAPSEDEDPLAVQKALRARVLDPVLAVAGDADTLWLSVDEALELVPLDALARADGVPLGSTIALRPLVSLLDLLEPPGTEVDADPALLAIGGLDYDAGGDTLAVLGEASTPVLEDTRSGKPQSFAVLLDSRPEVRRIAHYFGETFAAGNARVVTGKDAGKAALTDAAPHATFVHLATHGYFAPESVKGVADAGSSEGAITGLSPLALCGLALSGANLPPDDLGRHAGILTAEEILSLDLSRCYLVTLSACDTSLGVRRAGQGYASLRAALQGAGARFVLTSLWKVGDEATMELMVDFYRRLWVQKKAPHMALWDAKMEARKRGAPFRDWAGWVLTGR